MNKKEHKDVKVDSSSFEVSLLKIIDKKIIDIRGYISAEFDEPIFQLTSIVFEDGSELGCEGEHDCPYLVQSHVKDDDRLEYKGKYCKEFSQDVLDNIYKTDPDYEEN